MRRTLTTLVVAAFVSALVEALTSDGIHHSETLSRHAFFKKVATTAAIVTSGSLSLEPNIAVATAGEEEDIAVYFGCGCFWHVQHELVEAEKTILGRSDNELTARAGYAGGTKGAKDGKVCYHNAAQIADYGKLGHAEVVRVNIPPSAFPLFAAEYCKLFSKEGYRADQWGDRGSEYRNLVGIPGGLNSVYAKQLVETSIKEGDKLDFAKGKGDDPDARALSFIMDTRDFPFFTAEQYHQFHDGFAAGENYPNSYNALASKYAKEGNLGNSDCPNGLLGIGALGL